MSFQFPQVVAELVQCVVFGRKVERGKDGIVNLPGSPAADGSATVQEHLQEPDDSGVVDLDSGIADRTDVHGQSQFLQQRKIHVHVEALRLETGKAVGDGLESFPHSIQMIQSLLQTEVTQVVGAKFVAQVTGELLILFEKGVLPIGTENVMAMLDLVDGSGQFAA